MSYNIVFFQYRNEFMTNKASDFFSIFNNKVLIDTLILKNTTLWIYYNFFFTDVHYF